MSRSNLLFVLWTLLAGAGIPMIGPLNSGMARSVGNPMGATAVLFAVALVAALALTIPFFGIPTLEQLKTAPVRSYGAGLLMGFYVLSATVVIPRFGAGNFVAFILLAQLATATVVDQFGFLGIDRRPADLIRVIGLLLIIGGIVLMQFVSKRPSATAPVLVGSEPAASSATRAES